MGTGQLSYLFVWRLVFSVSSYQPVVTAGGFADSSIRIHDVVEAGSSHQRGAEEGLPAAGVTCLRGHTGAVYGVDFSPDQQLLLSASADSTVRLWSTELGANLVMYRHAPSDTP